MLSNVPMVRAGDTLIVCVARGVTETDARTFKEQVERALPGVKVAFFEQVTGLAVFRPDDTDGE